MYYLEEAKHLKAKADQWELVAEYHEKFPQEYSGDSETLHKHIVNVRAIADDYPKAMHEARDLAAAPLIDTERSVRSVKIEA